MSWNHQPPSTSVSVRRSKFTSPERSVSVAALVLWLSCWTAVVPQTQLLDRILAIVDGEVIMQSDVRAFVELGLVESLVGSDTEAEVLTYLIERRLMVNEANRFVVAEPDASVVDRRYAEIRERFSSEAELGHILDRNGFSPDDLRQVLVDEVRREAYVTDRFSAVDAGLREQARAEWVAGLVSQARIRRTP